MKRKKIVGLTAMATAVAMTVGAGSASATELCTENVSPCPAAKKLGVGTTVHAVLKSGTVSRFTTPSGTVTCNATTIQGKTSTAGAAGEPVKMSMSSFTFGGCSYDVVGNPPCKVTGAPAEGNLELLAGAGGNGSMTLGPGESEAGVEVKCNEMGSLIECTFRFPLTQLAVSGGNPAHITASETAAAKEGVLCPLTMKWDATYEVTSPKPLWLVNP